jgi:RNA methyltransferase, TrmH family
MIRTPCSARVVSSATNSLLKVFRRALREGVTREGWVAIEGPIVFAEALRSGSSASGESRPRSASRVRSVLIASSAVEKFNDLLPQLPPDTELAQAPDSVFQSVAATVNPQGIAALVEVQPPEFASILRQTDLLLLVACGVQDPGNLGTMMRSAEAFGASAFATLKSTVSLANPKAVRASGGAVFRLPAYAGFEDALLLAQLARVGVRVIAADPRASATISVCDLRGPLALLAGNEAAGLGPELSRRAEVRLRIPMQRGINSINAAIAAGIFLYEAARQRSFEY